MRTRTPHDAGGGSLSTSFVRDGRTITPPKWPTFVLGALALLATLSLLQGWVDVVLPSLRGTEAFGFLFSMTKRYGAGFFIAYVFIHNLGLACLVPGYGFLAAWFERHVVNRFRIGILLTAAVFASILVAARFIIRAPQLFELPVALALLVGESCGVLALAVASARELRGFVPTPAYEWSLVTPFRRLGVPMGYSALLLLVLSVWEAYAVLGA
jgi:hypothetical protein